MRAALFNLMLQRFNSTEVTARIIEEGMGGERRLTIQEILLLAEAIFDYGLTIQGSEQWSGLPPPYVIITISELAVRFRKTSQGINDTLLLLRAMNRAEPIDCDGHWKLKLTDVLSGREDVEGA